MRRTSRLNDSVDRQWGEFARLVSRRGDEANDQIGIARAAFFPSLVLGAASGFTGTSITNWFNWPSRFWAVGPQMSQTIFDAGRRRAVF